MHTKNIPQSLEDFAEVFEEFFPDHDFNWKKYPNRWMGLCPFHKENRHSFNIFYTPDGELAYKCFSCDAKGNVYSLLKGKSENIQIDDSQLRQAEGKEEQLLKKLADEFVVSAKESLIESIDKDQVEVYHLKRKIIPKEIVLSLKEVIDFFNIGIITEALISKWEAKKGEFKEFLRLADEKIRLLSKTGYFVFPYYSLSGNLVAIKVRDISSSSRSSRVLKLFKQKAPAYFGGLGFLKHFLKQKDGWIYPVIITEGETDAISSFMASGIPALSVGSASNYTFLLEDKFSDFGFFPIVFPDFDPYSLLNMGAGREAIVRLYNERRRRKIKEKIYVLVNPEAYDGKKDINEALVNGDARIRDILDQRDSILPLGEAVSKFYEDWQEWKLEKFELKQEEIEQQLKGLGEVYADFLSIKKTQEKKELSIDDIENMPNDLKLILGRFPAGKTSVIASFGGVGKTTYAIILALEIASKENKKVLLWITEHSPESIKKRIKRIKETPFLKEFYQLGRHNVFFKTDIPEPFVNSDKNINNKAFKELRNLFQKYDVLILDPFLTFVEGEENDNVVIRKVFKKIHSILSEFEEKYIIFLHHFGKLALKEASLSDKDIKNQSGRYIEVKRNKVEDLIRSVRGASAIVDAARYVEALVLTKKDRKRYVLTIKTNEDTRPEGNGERIPELISIKEKKKQLFERVRKLVMVDKKLFTDSPEFKRLEKFGITSYRDFEEKYEDVPMKTLEFFVFFLEKKYQKSEPNELQDADVEDIPF